MAGIVMLAARNLLRHRARTAAATAAVAFGVVSLILSGGFVHDLYLQLGESLIRSQSGHLQIGRAAYFAEGSRSPEKHMIRGVDGIKQRVREVRGVKRVMARLNFNGLLNNGRTDTPVLGIGIEPTEESELATSIRILQGRTLSDSDRRGILVGEGLARARHLRPGDPVTLLASTIDGAVNTGDFEVVGVFQSFSKEYDERAVRIPLSAANDLLGTEDASLIVVLLDSTELTSQAHGSVSRLLASFDLVVKRWEDINDFYANTVALYDRQFAVLRIIILVMVLLGVANAVNMSVFERTAEFGTMRALGNRGGFVIRLILGECFLLGLLGAVAGAIGGIALAAAISWLGIPMPPPPDSNVGYTARIMIEPAIVCQAALVGVAAAVFSGVVPALRMRKVAIVDALRTAI